MKIHRTTKPLSTKLRNAILAPMFGTALFGAIVTYAPADAVMVPIPAEAAPSESRVDRLLERHSCWSGDAPAEMVGVIPPRAVVSLPGERAEVVDGGVGLEIVFGGAVGTVHGFCKSN